MAVSHSRQSSWQELRSVEGINLQTKGVYLNKKKLIEKKKLKIS